MNRDQKNELFIDSNLTAEKKSLEQEVYDTRFKLNLLLEITDAVHYISYRTQPGKSFYSDTNKRIWIEEVVHKKFDVVANDEVWAGTIRDISGVEFYKEYIEESERRFKKIADSVPIMIWVSDENDVIVYNNEKARQFFGLKEEDQYSVGVQFHVF